MILAQAVVRSWRPHLKVSFSRLRKKWSTFCTQCGYFIAASPGARTANRMIVYAETFFRAGSADPWGARVYCATMSQQEVMLVQRSLSKSLKFNRNHKKTYSQCRNPIEIIKYCAPKSPCMPHVWCSFSELPEAILIIFAPLKSWDRALSKKYPLYWHQSRQSIRNRRVFFIYKKKTQVWESWERYL